VGMGPGPRKNRFWHQGRVPRRASYNLTPTPLEPIEGRALVYPPLLPGHVLLSKVAIAIAEASWDDSTGRRPDPRDPRFDFSQFLNRFFSQFESAHFAIGVAIASRSEIG
jgi:hypothetical protein